MNPDAAPDAEPTPTLVASPITTAHLIRLLHEIDGHLGLAVHRAEGARMEWRQEAADLITRIRQAIKELSRTPN